MSQPKIDDMTLKFERNEDNPHRPIITIWQAPQGALYRTIGNSGTIEVSTLTSAGWTALLSFRTQTDGVTTAEEALERWLQIQDPETDSAV